MKRILLSVIILSGALTVNAQLFTQNFNSSSTLSDYVSGTPDNTQFNAIGTTGGGVTVGIVGNKLRYSRTATNTGSFSRSTDFSSIPTILKYSFELSVSGNSVAQTTAAVFQVGSGFGTANSAEANSAVHSRLGINFAGTDGTFSIRDIGASASSGDLTGSQTLTWFINNSGNTITYTNPGGGTSSLGDDKWDLWAGTTLIFDERGATTTTQTLSDMKFVYTTGVGTIDIDNIVLTELTTLPVTLSSFIAKGSIDGIDLTWQTASEQNNSHFEISRSQDGQSFSKIAELKGSGTTNSTSYYSFIDRFPSPGVNYYKLSQVDIDGKKSTSDIISATSGTKKSSLLMFPSADKQVLNFSVYQSAPSRGTLAVFDLTGKKVVEQVVTLEKGYTNLAVPSIHLSNGTNIARLTTGSELLNLKFIKPE